MTLEKIIGISILTTVMLGNGIAADQTTLFLDRK
jgi:hypothetical protein